MAIQDFIYKIGADVTQFTKSISEVDAKLKELRKSLKTQTGQAIIDTNKQIVLLEQSLVNLKQVGLDKLGGATNNATNALFSLNQVARDLPFGFVAIQNNLPLVADSFQRLFKDSKGLIPGLKDLGTALIGGAGLSFAFGATISAITALTQKYGSLEKALSSILGLTITATNVQNELNTAINSTAGASKVEALELTNLTERLLDSNISSEERKKIINLTNKEYPDLLANIDAEKLTLQELSAAVAKRLDLQLKQIALNAQQKVIEEKLAKAFDQQYSSAKDIANLNVFSILGNELKGLIQELKNGNFQFNAAGIAIKGIGQTLNNNKTEVDAYSKALKNVQDELINVNKEIENAIISGKNKSKSDKQALQDAKEYAKFLEERIALEEKLELQRLKGIRTTSIKIGRDVKENLIRFGSLETKKPIKFFDIASVQEAYDKLFQRLKSNPLKPTFDYQPPEIIETPEIIKARKELASLYQPEDFNNAYNAIANGFFNPIQELFDNFIQTGKFAFQDFAKSVIQAISQIVAKVIATGIVTLLASIFTGGFGPGGAIKKAGGFGKILLNALGLGGNIANPGFGGVQPGGINMGGQVNLVLRGQDLVGSLNRTNSQFSRVG